VALFDQRLAGPPPGTATYGASLWIDLGLIPTGTCKWIGSRTYTSAYKPGTFELRTNKATKSAGNLTDTTLLDTWTSSTKVKSNTKSLAPLNVKTVVSSGVEHWWLYLKAKSATAQPYSYSIDYTAA
jgi:hypothetical protein